MDGEGDLQSRNERDLRRCLASSNKGKDGCGSESEVTGARTKWHGPSGPPESQRLDRSFESDRTVGAAGAGKPLLYSVAVRKV
jgi:hypothetical protein